MSANPKSDQLRALREARFVPGAKTVTPAPPVTSAVTLLAAPRLVVTVSVTHCPTCGHRLAIHKSAAEKQKAYRARRKVTS